MLSILMRALMMASNGSRLSVEDDFQSAYSSTTSLTISKPTNTVSGDLLCSFVGEDTRSLTWTPGSGFTERTDGYGVEVATKTAGASEPSSYTFSRATGVAYSIGAILRIVGAAYSVVGSVGFYSAAAPSITMPEPGLLLFASFHSNGGFTFTTPSGMDEVLVRNSDASASMAIYSEWVGAGVTGTREADGWAQVLLGVVPA